MDGLNEFRFMVVWYAVITVILVLMTVPFWWGKK